MTKRKSKLNLTPEAKAVHQECFRLLMVIAQRPGAAKLLIGARDALRLYAGYKSDRSDRYLKSSSPSPNWDGDSDA